MAPASTIARVTPMESLHKLRDHLLAEVEAASDLDALEKLRVAALGRQGRITELMKGLGKVPAEARDLPGFVSNRILMPFINEAAYALLEGVAEPEAIDTIAKLGFAHPIGPLALADLIGLDVCLDIMRVLYEGFHDSKYRPCPLLERMVEAGRLGRKSGRGFYNYAKA